MTHDFHTVYQSDRGQSVRLEVADAIGPDGESYPHHRLVVADGRAGAVVLALRGAQFLLVRSDRRALGRQLWELPRGVGETVDDGSSDAAIMTGLRELREETGWPALDARVVGRYVVDSSLYPQETAVIVCRVDERAERGVTDGEVEEQRWVEVTALPELIRDGTIQDAHSLAAVALWQAEEGQR